MSYHKTVIRVWCHCGTLMMLLGAMLSSVRSNLRFALVEWLHLPELHFALLNYLAWYDTFIGITTNPEHLRFPFDQVPV